MLLGVANGCGHACLWPVGRRGACERLVVGCDPRLPSHPKGIKLVENRSIVDILVVS